MPHIYAINVSVSQVCEVYRLHRETLHLAVDFVDRYLSYQSKIAKQRLQLIGVTSLFIASKIEVRELRDIGIFVCYVVFDVVLLNFV